MNAQKAGVSRIIFQFTVVTEGRPLMMGDSLVQQFLRQELHDGISVPFVYATVTHTHTHTHMRGVNKEHDLNSCTRSNSPLRLFWKY